MTIAAIVILSSIIGGLAGAMVLVCFLMYMNNQE